MRELRGKMIQLLLSLGVGPFTHCLLARNYIRLKPSERSRSPIIQFLVFLAAHDVHS